MSANDLFGEAKFGSKLQYFKIKDGANGPFRIIPPMGDLREEGVWSKYYRINYGYTNADGKSRPFESSLVKNNKTKMVEIPDAAVERFDKLKAKYEEAHKAGDTKTKEALLPLVGGPKSRYNVDSNHYLKVVDLQGNLGILKLRHKCKQQLDIEINALRDKGINPLRPDTGRFFIITRTGTRNETAFSVKILKQTVTIEGQEFERDATHVIDDALANRIKNELKVSLNNLFKKPSAEQIAQIVAESDLKTGVSPNIDKILGTAKTEATGDTSGDEGGDESAETTTTQASAADPVAEALKTVAATPAPAAAAPAPAQAQTAPASTPTPTAVETKPAAPAASAPQTTAEKVADMSDQEFLSSLGIN